MPLHDWTRVDPGIFHAFHLLWIAELDKAVNGGLLPAEYYALPEHHGGSAISASGRRRTLAVRQVSGHRLVAILEIVSPANKNRGPSVAEFADKVVSALGNGVHSLILDLLPPEPYDPAGMHGAIWEELEKSGESYDLPADLPCTVAGYVANQPVEIYLTHPTVGAALSEMPLFVWPDRYITIPLESTYAEAYRSMPAFWRDVLEGAVQQPTGLGQ